MCATTIYDAADLYDAMFPMLEQDDMEFYQRRAQACGSQILELACGSGRLTIPLASTGLRMTGLDLSETMLQRAQHKAEAANLPIRFIQGDMCDFHLNQQFDMIFIPANSLCHITDWRDVAACFRCVREHLAPHGVFAFEVFNPSLRILLRDPDQWYAVGDYTDAQGRLFRVSEQNRYDTASQINSIVWRVDTDQQQEDYHLTLRMFFPQELEALLEYNRFRIIARYGSMTEAPFSSESIRQIVVAGMIDDTR